MPGDFAFPRYPQRAGVDGAADYRHAPPRVAEGNHGRGSRRTDSLSRNSLRQRKLPNPVSNWISCIGQGRTCQSQLLTQPPENSSEASSRSQARRSKRSYNSRRRTFQSFRKLSFAQRGAMMNRAAEILEAEKEELGRIMTTEMGKTLGPPSPKRSSAPGPAATTPRTPNVFWRRRSLTPAGAKTRRSLSAHRRDSGGDAVEFSVLAGVSIHRAEPDGGQRGAAEACLERSAVRAAHRADPARGGVSGGRVSDAADRLEAGRCAF